jgi:5-(aminomethyl)-3-furanmethanol phosphate kinase
MRLRKITVVKLGGSHAFAAHLRPWLDELVSCTGRVVLVPGGGPFADCVRDAQLRMGFDDTAAHHMAMAAMVQYGIALAGLRPRLAAAPSLRQIDGLLRQDKIPIWLPVPLVLASRIDLPASWDVTSDSLAAWLAGRIGARNIMLVKHGKFDAGKIGLKALVGAGIVDPQFGRFLAPSGARAWIAGACDSKVACGGIDRGDVLGAEVDLCDM